MVNVDIAIFLEKAVQSEFAKNFAILQIKKKNDTINR
jgi:hypothetical protein